MLLGICYALLAGLMWGLVFLCPLVLPDYPAPLLAASRYLAFGVITLPLAWMDRKALKQLNRHDWLEAMKLTLVGNFIYYSCLAGAIQQAGGPLPTVIIGILPVVLSIAANIRNKERDGQLPWKKQFPLLMLIGAGIICVNQTEIAHLHADAFSHYVTGAILAFLAMICWTWYPLRNADWLRHHPDRNPRIWASAQGLITLPLAIVSYCLEWGWLTLQDSSLPMPLGTKPTMFVILMLLQGLLASWLGTMSWNQASKRLPTGLLGQLIVFETLAALFYNFVYRQQWPASLTLLGIILLLSGVLLAVRIKPESVTGNQPAT